MKPSRNTLGTVTVLHTTRHGIFRGDILQRLGVNQKYGRTHVHVSHKHYAVLYLYLEFDDRHQTERVPAPHKLIFT